MSKFALYAAAIAGLMPTLGFAWSGYNNVPVTLLQVYQAGQGAVPGALIQFSTASGTGADTEGCTQSGHGYAWIDWSSAAQPDGKALYVVTLLAAYLAGKPIGLGLDGCSAGGYPAVNVWS